MKKIFAIFLFSFFASSSFAQTQMMMHANNMLMLTAASESQAPMQAQVAAPVLINIAYQSDGTPIITTSTPQIVQPVLAQQVSAPPEDNKFGEIMLALTLGCCLGWFTKGIFTAKK